MTTAQASASFDRDRESLSIVIPAFNEEGAISSIIERALAARAVIAEAANLSEVEVIVVNDGSTDRTAEIARRYADIHLITYDRNVGYGAAIKRGFAEARGSLLSFLDADGTCNPLFFADLCKHLATTGADIAIGSRLGAQSHMPAVRRLGNRLFASLLTAWGGSAVTDSASGMRVIRRRALELLYPLPDGMHFTPAMSSLAIFDPRLQIEELPMEYSERVGDSKLKVVGDGVRFLRIIVDTALTYRPLRMLGSVGALLLLLGIGYGLYPVYYYLANRRIEEWMIYRLVAVAVALTTSVALISVGLLAQQTVSLIHEDYRPPRHLHGVLHRLLFQHLARWAILLGVGGVVLNWRSLVQYATTGRVTAHWIYVLVGGLLVTLSIELVAFAVLARVLSILQIRRAHWAKN